jgi:hypothetical protein
MEQLECGDLHLFALEERNSSVDQQNLLALFGCKNILRRGVILACRRDQQCMVTLWTLVSGMHLSDHGSCEVG